MRRENKRATPRGRAEANSRPRALRTGLGRDEIEGLRERYPIESVIAQYTTLRQVGRVLKGRCPLPGHRDRNPSFVVYVDDQHFYCFGCDQSGDVFKFLQLVEHLNFSDAVERLESTTFRSPRPAPARRSGIARPPLRAQTESPRAPQLSDEQTRILTATTTVYHTSLLTHPAMLDYVLGRGITMETIKRFRLGYATGQDLAIYFRFRGWDLRLAHELGLMNAHGEFFEQRIVIPELRERRVVYLTGRKTVESQQVKYLGLPGAPKPLYGLEWACGSREVYIVEGAFDMLTLIQWGYAAVALIGSHLKAEWMEELEFADRVYIVTDSDAPGRASAQRLASTFGERAIIVPPLANAKDVNELAMQPDGRKVFANLVAAARPRLVSRAFGKN